MNNIIDKYHSKIKYKSIELIKLINLYLVLTNIII